MELGEIMLSQGITLRPYRYDLHRNRDHPSSLTARLPAYCSATGRVLLSAQPKAHVEFLLNRMARPAFTPHTLTSMRDILREIQLVRTQGYAISDEELEIGLRSIAVPIRTTAGEMIATLSLSVSTSRMRRAAIVEKLLPELETARRNFAVLL